MDREGRTLWTDARMDDFARDVNERLRMLADTNRRLDVIDRDLANLLTDLSDCRSGVRALSDALTKRAEAREQERKERERERKTDRRWQFGAAMTAAALVISALAVLIPTLSGPV